MGDSAIFGSEIGAAEDGDFGFDNLISPRALHFGHLAVRPTYASGVSSVCEQFGQMKTAMLNQLIRIRFVNVAGEHPTNPQDNNVSWLKSNGVMLNLLVFATAWQISDMRLELLPRFALLQNPMRKFHACNLTTRDCWHMAFAVNVCAILDAGVKESPAPSSECQEEPRIVLWARRHQAVQSCQEQRLRSRGFVRAMR